MTKDEALDLALEALEKLTDTEQTYEALDLGDKAITAIKQALALDKMAENARELGLDYEPVLVQQPATLDEMHDIGNGIMYGEPAPVQEPVGFAVMENPITPPAQPAPVQPVGTYGEIHESMQALLRSGLQRDQQIYMAMKDRPLYTTPPAQPAPVAFEVGLVEWVGNKLMATPKVTTTPPASWMEMVTANLVREGVNKHKARELAEHFYGLAQRPFVGLTDEEILDAAGIDGADTWLFETAYAIEAKLRSKNNG
jgi:hypothetical protein